MNNRPNPHLVTPHLNWPYREKTPLYQAKASERNQM